MIKKDYILLLFSISTLCGSRVSFAMIEEKVNLPQQNSNLQNINKPISLPKVIWQNIFPFLDSREQAKISTANVSFYDIVKNKFGLFHVEELKVKLSKNNINWKDYAWYSDQPLVLDVNDLIPSTELSELIYDDLFRILHANPKLFEVNANSKLPDDMYHLNVFEGISDDHILRRIGSHYIYYKINEAHQVHHIKIYDGLSQMTGNPSDEEYDHFIPLVEFDLAERSLLEMPEVKQVILEERLPARTGPILAQVLLSKDENNQIFEERRVRDQNDNYILDYKGIYPLHKGKVKSGIIPQFIIMDEIN